MSKRGFGMSLTIDPIAKAQKRSASIIITIYNLIPFSGGFGRISTKDGLCIGPEGLTFNDQPVASLSPQDLVIHTEQVLGTGVSSAVKRATHKVTGRQYAIKVRISSQFPASSADILSYRSLSLILSNYI